MAGSGCNGVNNNGWFEKPTPDTGVIYTGPAISTLGICTGDRLSEIEEVILTKLQAILQGKEIEIVDLTLDQCEYIKQFIECCEEDKSLTGIADLILRAICDLNTRVEELEEFTEEYNSYVFDLGCLNVQNAKTQSIIQALIKAYCDLKKVVDEYIDNINTTITTTITNIAADLLDNAIQSCGGFGIHKSGQGSNLVIQLRGFVPPYCPQPYIGPESNFNADGTGKEEAGLCGFVIMDGRNGTPDWRGFTPIGATVINGQTGQPPLDARVDPAVSGDLDYAITVGQKKGEVKHKLTISEMPAHSHNISIAPHSHNAPWFGALGQDGNTGNPYTCPTNGGTTPVSQTELDATISEKGGSSFHENRQPSVGVIWMVRFN